MARILDFNRLETGLRAGIMTILEYREKFRQKASTLGTGDGVYIEAAHSFGDLQYLTCILELINWCNGENPLTVDQGGRVLRGVLEGLLDGSLRPPFTANAGELQRLYGLNLYMCHHQLCQMSSGEGFTTLAKRQRHECRHAISKCQVQGCLRGGIGFVSEASRRKHMKDYHSIGAIKNTLAEGLEVGILFMLSLVSLQLSLARNYMYIADFLGFRVY